MKAIDPNDLPFGQLLTFDVTDKSGAIVFKTGTLIERSDLEEHWLAVRRGLFVDKPDDADAHADAHADAPPPKQPPAPNPDDLTIGSTLERDVYDRHGVLLLRAGSPITPEQIDRIRARGAYGPIIRNTPGEHTDSGAALAAHDITAVHTDCSRQLDEQIEQYAFGELPASPSIVRPTERLTLGQLRDEAAAAAVQLDAATSQYHNIANDVIQGRTVAAEEARNLIAGFIDGMTRDTSVGLLALASQWADDDYLYSHCLKVSMLSMTVAIRLGYPREQVLDAGLGALLHDVGMIRIPESVRNAHRPLTPDERFQIQCHPIYTIDALERAGMRRQPCLLVSYQVHERSNRSGYPRRRPESHILPLSRIVAVADSYAAMTSPRPHRQPMTPYQAMETLLFDTAKGRYDRAAVRAFLDSISLFPVGSCVELSDGRRARVLRSNVGKHTRPVVNPYNDDGSLSEVVLDLTANNTLSVVRPLAELDPDPGPGPGTCPRPLPTPAVITP